MPPRKTHSAPASRVYKAVQPLEQVRFPARRKSVRSYGNTTTKRVPNLPKQDTLTQMDFVKMLERDIALQQEEEQEHRKAVEVFEDGVENLEKPKAKAKSVKKNTKRRRTLGELDPMEDEDEYVEGSRKRAKRTKQEKGRRKTTGDKPSSGTPKFLTQTITQLDWSTSSGCGNNDEEIREKEDEVNKSFDSSIFNIPSSSPPLPRKSSKVSALSRPSVAKISEKENHARSEMPPPQTPIRTIAQEIPSSESPATPTTPVPCQSGVSRRLPLNEKSTNTPIPFNPSRGRKGGESPCKVPRLEVRDTFDTTDVSQMTYINSTPKKSSPPKSVRFVLPEDPVSPIGQPSVKRVAFSKLEILDSDAESDENFTDEEEVVNAEEDDQAHHEPDTWYGEIGDETQLEADQLVASSTPTSNLEEVHPLMRQISQSQPRARSPDLAVLTQPTPDPLDFRQSPSDDEYGEHESHDYKTQFRESQRLGTQHFTNMAPRTISSDIFISLASQHMTDFLARKRTHLTCATAYPPGVSRLWIYVLQPIKRLTYMAVVGPELRPGEVENEDGIGNKHFNKKKGTWRAYEVTALYELADPLSIDEMTEREWVEEAPKKWARVRPAVIDELMGNLMPPIFADIGAIETEDEAEAEAESQEMAEEPVSSSGNDTQDAAEQLLNTMKQYDSIFTQVVSNTNGPHEAIPATIFDVERIPSSQEEMLPPPISKPSLPQHPDLSQATTVDLTQVLTPRIRSRQKEIIWESPTRPVHSSTPARLPTQLQNSSTQSLNHSNRENIVGSSNGSGSGSDPAEADSSIVVPYSVGSSQLLTKSQMERDAFWFDSIPRPPIESIMDSDEEEEL